VLKYGDVPPFQETQDYVVRVQDLAGGKTISVFSKKRGSDNSRTARAGDSGRSGPGQPDVAAPFMVHFHSGLKQPADKVLDKDPYYQVEYRRRAYRVRKDLVKEILKRAA